MNRVHLVSVLALIVAACGTGDSETVTGSGPEAEPVGQSSSTVGDLSDAIPEIRGVPVPDDGGLRCPEGIPVQEVSFENDYSLAVEMAGADLPSSPVEVVMLYYKLNESDLIDRERVDAIADYLIETSPAEPEDKVDSSGYPIIRPEPPNEIETADGRVVKIERHRVVLPWDEKAPDGPFLVDATVTAVDGRVYLLDAISFCEIVNIDEQTLRAAVGDGQD